MTTAHALAHDAPLARVLARFKGAKRRSDGSYLAQCSHHEDRSPSLSIREGDDGRVLLHCFAGCTVEQITRGAGLEMQDLFPPKESAGNGGAPLVHRRPVLVKSYDYVDEHGTLLYQVCRFEPGHDGRPKSFRQRRPDPDRPGEWIWKHGSRQVLYRLPELLEAIGLERRVCIVEGEKDVETLTAHGFAATTSPGGAGNWRDEYAGWLRDAAVVIVPDNDAPGRQHAEQVAASLTQAGAASVRVLVLADLPPKGDVSDWFARGGTVQRFDALLASAPAWRPGSIADTDAASENNAPDANAAASEGLPPAICALDAPPPEPIGWTITDLWTKGDIGLLVGDGGAFKSSAALHLAAAIAGGYHAFDRFPTERRPVLIISAEDPAQVLLMRLEAFVAGHGWDRRRVLENVHFFAQTETSLADARWRAHLLAEARRLNVGFVVLDPLAELLDGDENSNTDVRPVIKFVRALAEQTAAAVAIVHHAGKASPEKRALDRIRGASALGSAARVILFFEFRPDGVYVENLKMSRATKLEPFVVERSIDQQPGNRAMWTSARLSYQTAKEHIRSRGETFVLAQLQTAHPRRLSTADLRRLGPDAVPKVSNEEIQTGIRTLQLRGVIDYADGPRGARLWGLLDRTFGQYDHPADETSAGSKTDPADPARTLPGQGPEATSRPCRMPLGFGQGQGGSPAHSAGSNGSGAD